MGCAAGATIVRVWTGDGCRLVMTSVYVAASVHATASTSGKDHSRISGVGRTPNRESRTDALVMVCSMAVLHRAVGLTGLAARCPMKQERQTAGAARNGRPKSQ